MARRRRARRNSSSIVERVVLADHEVADERKAAEDGEPDEADLALIGHEQVPLNPRKSDDRPDEGAAERHNPEHQLAEVVAHEDEDARRTDDDSGPEVVR